MKANQVCLLLSFLLAVSLACGSAMAGGNDAAGLFAAADKGDVVKIKQVLAAGTDVNAADPDGWTALMVAASAGRLPVVQALLKAGADVNAKSKQGETPLMAAALSGNAVIVKSLLAEGADKTAASAQGLTAADVAIRAKHPELAKVLQLPPSAKADAAPPAINNTKKIEAKVDAAASAFQGGRYAEAAGLFRETVGLDPRHALAWHFLGQSLERTGDKDAAINAYLRSLDIAPDGDLASRNQKFLAKLPLHDCADCPDMVVIPAGRFTMGSPGGETGRSDNEGPLHEVNVARFALSKYEVTVGEFRAFARASGYRTDAEKNTGNAAGCYAFSDSDGKTDWRAGVYWEAPGFAQTERHPAVCLSWNDARAYLDWLSDKTGKKYRLPSEAEWAYAARAGAASARLWGENPDEACRFANVADQSKSPTGRTWNQPHGCNDGYWYTAPAGSYQPNAFGLHDMIGNAWEWTEDCWHENYGGAPTDGSAWLNQCSANWRVLRGGSWKDGPQFDRSAIRDRSSPAGRYNGGGFRPARMLP